MLTATYATYLVLVVLITIYVARTLSKNGVSFLIDGFGGNEALAHSINHLLVVGFYLVNLGFAMLQLETRQNIVTLDQALVFLSSKIGFVMMILGFVHFFNLLAINMFKNGQLKRQRALENTIAMEKNL